MIETTAIIASARIGWKLLAKLPVLGRLLLRWKFPIVKCNALLVVEVSANHGQFTLQRIRPAAGLIGVEVRLHNHLPFQIEFEIHELRVNIDSCQLLTQTLNVKCIIPATGSATIRLPELNLTDQQANWIRNRGRDCESAQIELYWRCCSSVHDWTDQRSDDSLISVNQDRT